MTVENLTTNKVEPKKQETSTAISPKSVPTTPTATKTAELGNSNALVFKQQGTYLNNRPIEASHLNIVSTYKSVGSLRPVTASTIKFNSSIAISGNRPIGASSLIISDTYKVMGSRPVASNDIDDPTLLMGFLD
jgi:hypothetical protein